MTNGPGSANYLTNNRTVEHGDFIVITRVGTSRGIHAANVQALVLPSGDPVTNCFMKILTKFQFNSVSYSRRQLLRDGLLANTVIAFETASINRTPREASLFILIPSSHRLAKIKRPTRGSRQTAIALG